MFAKKKNAATSPPTKIHLEENGTFASDNYYLDVCLVLAREEKNFFKTIPPLFQTKFTIPITAKPVELKEGKSSSKSVIPKALKYVLILKIFLLLEHF